MKQLPILKLCYPHQSSQLDFAGRWWNFFVFLRQSQMFKRINPMLIGNKPQGVLVLEWSLVLVLASWN